MEPIVVILIGLAVIAQKFDPSKYDSHWTISFTPEQVGITAKTGSRRTSYIKALNVSEIKSIDIHKPSSRTERALVIATQTETVKVGGRLSKDALVWLKNYLIMEVAGLAWRPLHGVDRSVSRASKTEIATNPTLLKQDLALRLVEIYIDEAPAVVDRLGEAVANKNEVGVRQHSHWLKSASANVGAQHMSQLCQVMQIYGMDNDLERADVLFQEIERTNQDVMLWLANVRDVSATIIAQPSPFAEDSEPTKQFDSAELGIGHLVDQSDDALEAPDMIDAKILIIDDSAVSREIAKNFLSDFARKLAFANDGEAALEQCARETFDLILTDCEMFGMDGYQFTKAFRDIEQRQGDKRTPIIALTAHALKGDRTRCIEAGMDDYLSKPFAIDELHDKLREWLERPVAPEPETIPKVAAMA